MTQTIGESREQWGKDICKMAEDFANNMKQVAEPFYVVYACKQDKAQSERLGYGVFKQAIKAYFKKPMPMLGILVWYADHKNGIFRFMPELSAPPDVPVDPSLLSEKAEDALPTVMAQGEKMGVLLA